MNQVKEIVSTIVLVSMCSIANAQFVTFNPGGDTAKTVSVEGYVDVYFGFDFNQPKDANRSYFVSHHRHNETNVNLAYISIKYSSPRARATFTPGFGTYMNANYAAERVTLRNIVEANVGIKLFKHKNIWLDAGVFGAPYTTETAVAFDQISYTRSFAAEYSPYYLTGGKLTLPLTPKVNLYLYLVNGWQIIEDVNDPLAFGSQVEYKPNDKLSVNWNTYIGNEHSASAPNNKGRYFSDLYVTYNPNSKLSLAVDIYAGRQKRTDSFSIDKNVNWGQGNINARYFISSSNTVSARVEYFRDYNSIFIIPVTGVSGFDCYSYTLGFSHNVTNNVMVRLEGRYFNSTRDVFFDDNLLPTNSALLVTGGLIAKF